MGHFPNLKKRKLKTIYIFWVTVLLLAFKYNLQAPHIRAANVSSNRYLHAEVKYLASSLAMCLELTLPKKMNAVSSFEYLHLFDISDIIFHALNVQNNDNDLYTETNFVLLLVSWLSGLRWIRDASVT